MDFWVFVAAASAACLTTKYIKNTPRDLKGCKATLNGSWYIAGLAHGKRMKGHGDVSRNNVFDKSVLGTNATAEAASTSGSEEMIARNLEQCILLSIASLPTEYTVKIADVARENENTSGCDICSSSGDEGSGNFEGITCSFQRSVKSNSSLRSRHRHLWPNPLTSLESCFVAQLCNHNAEPADPIRSLPKPSSSVAGPLLFTDRSNTISRSSEGFVGASDATAAIGIQKQSQIEISRNLAGVPPLPSLPTEITSDARSDISICCVGSRRKLYSQNGWMHGIILFSLGLYVGIISSVARKRTDVDKLKDLLNQKENLVQDLQEELEMKDSVIIKELDNDISGSWITHQTSFPDADPTLSSNERHESDVNEELHKPGRVENLDSMRKIEAELEAELERLGLNVGLDNVQLNNMMVDIPKGHGDLEKDGSSGSSTAPSANYAVSLRALTLRLHELIESQLEERIQELELALENSQRKLRLMESTQKVCTNRRFSSDVARPVVMNLPGEETLSAYGEETYEEFMKFDSSEETTPPCRDNSPVWQSIKPNGTTKPLLLNRVEVANKTLSFEQGTDSLGMSRDESSDANDNMLIRQLVERTKRDAQVVMKVQQLLFSDQGDLL
ncbi:hypothetical protein MLD38_031868 [Melastoma candidum]|uniref:Uncharacterized protein n=1 Tax=Melastoma candidum TaxID=119954 RepID=A0ACB9MSF0_9MYRT|nr:hypothetical protein MLD38_031868 [Melastoma candidum]